MSSLNRAIEIATKAHEGSTDKYGAPYINHVTRVMDLGQNDNEKIVGVLHDVIEDTQWTFEDLEKEGFSIEVIEALKCVTKTSEDEDYAEFITRVKINPLAVKVKLNDLTDNMDIKRMPEVLESDMKRLNKYLKAYNELIKSQNTKSNPRKGLMYSDVMSKINQRLESMNLLSMDSPKSLPDSDNSISVTFIKRKK
jgi:(p)ppGpp synthase/HD superfamily hydrolase